MHVPPPAPLPFPAPAPMVSSRRGRRVGAGVLVGLVGLAVGLATALLGSVARTSTVEGFARAPVGCTTTLQFDRVGVFTVYLETKGRLDEVTGDCSLSGGSYEHSDGKVSVGVTLTGRSGEAVPVQEIGLTRSYDTGAFRGRSLGIVNIADTGEYQLSVQGDSSDVVVAVGGSPDKESRLLTVLGVVVALLGTAGGALLALSGRRRPPPGPSPRPTLTTMVPPAPPSAWGPPRV